MNLSILLQCTLLAVLSSWAAVCAASDYHERLDLQPLPGSSLLASFNFRTNESKSAFDQQHFRYFPRSLGQILQHANTQELHLRFTTGRWDADGWGARPWRGSKEGGTGVELWAWIEAETYDAAFTKWITLTQSLSGLFCASLNFVDSTKTSSPVVTFEPAGDHANTSQLHLLHGTLPGEVVCTENLTPFLKLLPCKGKAGISSLFDGHKLFDASWQSMSIDVRPVCTEDAQCRVEMEQTVDMVLDIDRSKRPRDNPIPRPVPDDRLVCDESKPYNSDDTCYPLETTTEKAWSFAEIFGRPISGACPLTDEEGPGSKTVCLHAPHERNAFVTAGVFEAKNDDNRSRCYSILRYAPPFNLMLPEQSLSSQLPLEQPVLHAERTMIGHGQERGGMRTILTNPSNTAAVDFIYLETLPWFMRPYLHTLHAKVATGNSAPKIVPTSDIIKETFYRPSVDRQRGTQLELRISVPPASTVTLIYEFEKAILRYTEYPPDANRGFNVAPAVIRILDGRPDSESSPTYLRTTSLLLPLPTPDFSMPYNVIILTSTVMALAFGNIFNLLVGRFVAAEEVERAGLKKIKAKIVGRIVAIRDRLTGKAVKIE